MMENIHILVKGFVEYMNKNYLGSWIVRGGLFLWQAEAPDINTCEFFLWSFMKYRVYQSHNAQTVQYVARCQVDTTAGIRNETRHFQLKHLMEWHLAARWSCLKCNLDVNVYVGTDEGN